MGTANEDIPDSKGDRVAEDSAAGTDGPLGGRPVARSVETLGRTDPSNRQTNRRTILGDSGCPVTIHHARREYVHRFGNRLQDRPDRTVASPTSLA
jgi:hypothetical protein